MAVILALDMPEGVVFGIDLQSWTVGDRFKGLFGVPIGVHYVYWSAVGTQHGELAVQCGLFIAINDMEQVCVHRWDPVTEQLLPLTDRFEVERYEQGVRNHDFDRCLGPFPLTILDQWISLVGHISSQTIHRINPINTGLISSSQAPCNDTNRDDQTRAYYLAIPIRPSMKGEPGVVTQSNMDRTAFLEKLIGIIGDEELLGEMQYAFVAFLLGQSFDAFDQWKSIVVLLCNCEQAMSKHEDLYAGFIDVLCAQLIKQFPPDFFIPTAGGLIDDQNFIRRSLADLFELASDVDELRDKVAELRDQVERRFGWIFPRNLDDRLNASGQFDPDDEDAPAIVDLNPVDSLDSFDIADEIL